MKILIIAIVLRLFSNPTANVIQKKLSGQYGSFWVNAITYAGLCLAITPLFLKTDFTVLTASVWFYGITGGLLGAYALALFQLSSIITIFFGYKFFKERNILKKLLGTVIMIVGAVIIICG